MYYLYSKRENIVYSVHILIYGLKKPRDSFLIIGIVWLLMYFSIICVVMVVSKKEAYFWLLFLSCSE